MLRLSKRVEYGLMALQHLAKRGGVSTVREISDQYDISYDLLSKILQDLKRDGVIDSYQGVRGGYALMLTPESINLTRVVSALEEATGIMECATSASGCTRSGACSIEAPMHKLQATIDKALSSVTVAQLM
jgi:Rrf2 family protein